MPQRQADTPTSSYRRAHGESKGDTGVGCACRTLKLLESGSVADVFKIRVPGSAQARGPERPQNLTGIVCALALLRQAASPPPIRP